MSLQRAVAQASAGQSALIAQMLQPGFLVPTHLPVAHLSPVVHLSLSSHPSPSGAATVPHLAFASSQPAVWQGVPVQSRACPVHVPDTQASLTVQYLPSEQTAPSSSVTWM